MEDGTGEERVVARWNSTEVDSRIAVALHNESRRTNSVRKYATSIRRSPIWNILVQSALSITLRHDGLLRIVQKDVTNWRLASADCESGPSLRCVAPAIRLGIIYAACNFRRS